MMGKGHRQIIFLLSIFLVTMTFFTIGSADENDKVLIRRKRNIICYFGLTGFISNVCYEALKGIHKYDPVSIGSLLGGKLQNGEFEGLSTLRNSSNINVECDNDLVTLNTILDVSGASINYQWKQKMLLSFGGSVWTTVNNIQFALELTLNMTHGFRLDVANLKLTQMNGMKFGFSGLGPLNPIIKLFGNAVLHLWDRKITQIIEKLLRNTLENELSKFNISF